MGKINGLAHIGLFATDIERSIKFYTEVLGFEHYYGWESASHKIALLRSGSCVIEMIQCLKGEPAFTAGRIDHIALQVEDIEAVYEDLKSKGVRFHDDHITVQPTWGPTGAKYILFSGPDDETIEIAEAM